MDATIAVPYDAGQIFQHFGKATQFKLYTIVSDKIAAFEVFDTEGVGHEDLALWLVQHAVNRVVCGHIGPGAQGALRAAGIVALAGVEGSADTAIDRLMAGKLDAVQTATCSHHAHGGECSAHCGSHCCGRAMLVALLAGALFSGCTTVNVPKGTTCTFEFPFMGDYDVVNRTTFGWDDAFVTNNASEYHHELAGPLAAIAASTYGSRTFTDVRSLMDLGFPLERIMRCYEDNDVLKYHHPKYGNDVVGGTIASRKCEIPGQDFDIVVVALRGTVGRQDWISNINMANTWGAQTNLDMSTLPVLHEGFHKAAQCAAEGLILYAEKYKVDLSKAKILITGHSRGAAVANLLGKMLDDMEDGPKNSPLSDIRRENVYVYSIATPNVTIRPATDVCDPKYNNIFSIVSPEDLVPMVPFDCWGGARYGRTLMLKCFNSIPIFGSWAHPGYVGMKNNFKDICGYEFHHMLLGTNLVARVPGFAQKLAPTVGHFYYIKPEMRAEGNATSIHSFLEMIFWKAIASSTDPNRNFSLMDDVSSLTKTYETLTDSDEIEPERKVWDHKLRFINHLVKDDKGDESFNPDGRDFSRQPGFTDIVWKITCMHAPATYISWLKSGVDHGPDAVFENWDEIVGE